MDLKVKMFASPLGNFEKLPHPRGFRGLGGNVREIGDIRGSTKAFSRRHGKFLFQGGLGIVIY